MAEMEQNRTEKRILFVNFTLLLKGLYLHMRVCVCVYFPSKCIDCVCPTSVGVWSEGESPSVLCGAPQWCTGQDGGQSPQPFGRSGGVCCHRAGKRSVCVFFIATYGGLKRSEEARESLPEFLSLHQHGNVGCLQNL